MNPRDPGAVIPRVRVAVCPLAEGVAARRDAARRVAVGAAAHVRGVAVDSPTATNLRGAVVALGDPRSRPLPHGVAAEQGDPPIRMPPRRGALNPPGAVVARVGRSLAAWRSIVAALAHFFSRRLRFDGRMAWPHRSRWLRWRRRYFES